MPALRVCAALLAMALAAPVPAADPPKPCTAAEHRQFDFWVGDWVVRNPEGKEVGRNRIEKSNDGCVLHENWTSLASKHRGESFNIYDAPRQAWHQTWVDNSGLLLLIEGGWRDGAMVLEGDRPGRDGTRERHRITWTPEGDGLRQLWQISADAGKTWKVAFDGRYRKK